MGNHSVLLKQVESSVEVVIYHQKSQFILKYCDWLIGFHTQFLQKHHLCKPGCTRT